jgi:hypothetical protein
MQHSKVKIPREFFVCIFRPRRKRNRSLRQFSASRKVTGSIHDKITAFFNCANLSSRTVTLGSTQPLTEMNIVDVPGGKVLPVRKADNLTDIPEPIVSKIREPRCPISLWASTTCYCYFTVLTFSLFTSESEAVVMTSDVCLPLEAYSCTTS